MNEIKIPLIDGRTLARSVLAALKDYPSLEYPESGRYDFAIVICHKCGHISPDINFLTCCGGTPTCRHFYPAWEAMELFGYWN